MIYDKQCEGTWEKNKKDAEAICEQFKLHRNRGAQNLYLCCRKKDGSEDFRVFMPNHTIPPIQAYQQMFKPPFNEEYDILFRDLKNEGVDTVIVVINIKKIHDEEILEDVEGMLLKWTRYACLQRGIMLADIIYVDGVDTESQKETDEYLREKHNGDHQGSLDEFYKRGANLYVR